MEKNKAYQNLLNKMLILENVGEILYKVLISKAKNKNLRLIYDRLALNERETARYIEKEISAIDKNHPILLCLQNNDCIDYTDFENRLHRLPTTNVSV